MKKIKVTDPVTGEIKHVTVKSKSVKSEYSIIQKIFLWVIILILVIPVVVTAIMYIVGQ